MLDGLMDFYNVYNSTQGKFGYSFYGKFTRMTCAFSTDGKLQLSLAKALDPNATNKGKREKGTNAYDNEKENMAFFSVSPAECGLLISNLDAVVKGTYVDKKAQDDKYKNLYQVVHFNEKATTRVTLARQTGDNNAFLGIKLTIVPLNKDKTLSYLMKMEELVLFRKFVEASANSPVFIQQIKMLMKTVGAMLFETNKDNKDAKNKFFKAAKEDYTPEADSYDSNTDDDPPFINTASSDSSDVDEDIPWGR